MLGAHGLRGGLVCRLLTDFPERFERTREVLIGDPPERRRLERFFQHGANVVLKLEGIDNRTAAEVWRGALIQVPREQAVKLPAGEYFWHQIIGLRVQDGGGEVLGSVAEVLPTGGNDVYVVRRPNGTELLLPAIRDVIRHIDVEHGLIVVNLLPGLES